MFVCFDLYIQGISEKCTETFKFGCLVIFWSIYLSKSCRKSGLSSLSIYQIHKKKYIYVFNYNNIIICKYILKKYIWVIFITMIILDEHNDPCFKNKSSSLSWNIVWYTFQNKAVAKYQFLFSSCDFIHYSLANDNWFVGDRVEFILGLWLEVCAVIRGKSVSLSFIHFSNFK